ncbi:MAG: sulfite exporter TauE/SafE family protein [Flavobacteriales bacterium]|nr:sulfite exporter TauE/SafE family protein [Flavobacteriales bacterium]
MEYLIVGSVALFTSLLTFFSGFGVGTILTPAFILFFPIDVAIAMTAIVHFLNNLFKLGLTYKDISRTVLLRFGLPAIPFAFLGAWLLLSFSGHNRTILQFNLFGKPCEMKLIELIVGTLMFFFAIAELFPSFKNSTIKHKQLFLGGSISGFFGGLTGHQGALRTMFLLKSGLSKEQFIATGIAIACLVDISRLTIYAKRIQSTDIQSAAGMITVAVLCAFTGAYFGKKLLNKVTIHAIQYIVSGLIVLVSGLLILGWI